MRARDVEAFFTEVNRRIDFPLQVILTGGAAGILYGMARATYDIDFEVHVVSRSRLKDRWEKLQRILEEVSAVTRITPQYAEDIDRWSSIALPLRKSRLYKKIGKVEVRLLEPSLWAIGKLTRFLASDVSDLIHVLRGQSTKGDACARLWGRALAVSPRSPAQSTFKRQVDHFFDQHSKAIWGRRSEPERLKKIFLRAAQSSK